MPSVNDKLMKAIGLQGEGKLEEATKLFHQILKADSNNAAALRGEASDRVLQAELTALFHSAEKDHG